MAQGMGDLQRESAKLDGVPVLQVISMGGSGEGQPSQSAAANKQEQPAPSITGALGRLGGLGGLGRRKQEEPPKQEKPPAQAASSGSASLLEMTSEMSGFSTASIDAARLQVPAGFKQVESEMMKALR